MSGQDRTTTAPGAEGGGDRGGTSDLLAAATSALRQHTDTGWTRIRTEVLASAMAAFRPSAPVRGHHEGGDFYVAADVLVSRVREAVDALRSAAAQKVTVDTDDAHDLQQMLVQVIAAYGNPLLEVADTVRRAAARQVTLVLGIPAAWEKVAVDIHIGDVTDDPARL